MMTWINELGSSGCQEPFPGIIGMIAVVEAIEEGPPGDHPWPSLRGHYEENVSCKGISIVMRRGISPVQQAVALFNALPDDNIPEVPTR